MTRELLIGCLLVIAVACATRVPPTSATTIDWAAVADEGTPTIVTQDPDGDERVTKLWVVVVDGEGLIRTGDSRWFRNIERDPDVVFWIGGYAYPLRAELVTDDSVKKRAGDAFREKYGWMDIPFSNPDDNVLRLVPRESQ
jgi:hypothetical protein